MWTQPVLTANGTIGTDEFAVLSGGGADSAAWQAFDNSASSYCNAMNNGAWIEFYSKNPLEISSITITSSTQGLPSTGIFQVSYDGNSWKDVQQWEDVDQTASSAQINLETPTVGNYFRLLSQGKSLVKPDTDANIGNVIITAEEVCQPVSISRTLSNNSFGDKYISHYLPFDNSTTENIRGNDWIKNGTLSISENNAINGTALQLNNSYLSYTNGTFLGGQDFTIRLSFCITSFNGNYQRIVTLFNTVNSDKDCVSFRRNGSTSTYYIVNFGTSSTGFSLSTNTIYHFEWSYSHSESLSRIFINGELKTTLNKSIPRTKFNIVYLGKSEYTADGLWTGSIDEFMIIDGVAVHKKNFPNPDNIKWDDIKTNITKLYPLSDFLIFTGNSGSYATIPTNILTTNTSFTAEFKISSTSTQSSNDNFKMPTIFGIEIAEHNQDDFGFCINNGKLAYWAEPIWTPSTQAYRILTDYFVSDGEPHIISFVSELSKSVKIYCDGKLVHENNYNITIPYNSILYIGSNTTSNAPLAMKFYEARFWSKALTQEEIFANIDGTEEGLEAWYKTSSNDLSNHNRNLTLHNVLYYQYKVDLISENADIQYTVHNNINNYRKVYLPFNESATEDLCGNEWTIVGSLAVENGALSLESSSTRNYIYTTPPELGMSDFTIDWWEYIPASVNSFTGQILCIDGTTGSNTRCLALAYWRDSTPSIDLGRGTGASWSFDGKSIGTKIRDKWVHRAVVRSGNTIYAFENGTLFTSMSFSYSISVSGSSLFIGNFARENRQFVGKLKNVRIHVGVALWTKNFTPPTAADYLQLQLDMDFPAPFEFDADIELVIKNNSILLQALKVYLPFDKSPTEDLCGNKWISFYDPIIKNKALQLDHFAYLKMKNTIALGGQDFTIHGWFNVSSNRKNNSSIFSLHKTEKSNVDRISIKNTDNTSTMQLIVFDTTSNFSITPNTFHHFSIVYSHSSSKIILFIDGIQTLTMSKTIPLTDFTLAISHSPYMDYYGSLGSIKNFTINKTILWQSNYTTSLSDFYTPLDLYFRQKQEIDINCDIIKKTINNINQFLTHYLPFDTSVTEDLCGNIWNIKEGTAVLTEENAFSSSALQLDGTGYLSSVDSLILGGRDFTIDCWCYPLSTNTNYNRIWEIKNSSNQIIGVNFPSATQIRLKWIDSYTYTFKVRNSLIHVALVYQHKKSLVSLYINGIRVCKLSKTLELTSFPTFYIGQFTGGGNDKFKGTIDQFRVYNGIARWTENFNVPTINDYPSNISKREVIDNYLQLYTDDTADISTEQSLLSGAEEFTIEIKMSTTDNTTTKDWYMYKFLVGVDNVLNGFGICLVNNTLHFYYEIDISNNVIATDCIINDGNIHKISITYINHTLNLYCDNNLIKSKILPSYGDEYFKLPTDKTIHIGWSNYYYATHINMKFYEARFWSKALTQEEIFANIDGTEEGLEAWYMVDSAILKDFSTHNRNISITGHSFVNRYYLATFNNCDILYQATNNNTKDLYYLPLIDSPTNDLYNHQWSNIHLAEISDYALQLNGTDQFITANNKIYLGGQDFTIEFYLTKLGGTSSGPVFSIYYDETHFMTLNNEGWYINYTKTDSMPTGHNHVAFVYKNDTQTIYYYLNGSLVNSRTTTIFNTSKKFIVDLGSNSWGTWRTQFWKGSIEHFHINSFEALYNDSFDPLLDRDHGLDIGFQSSTDKIPLYIYNKIDVKVRNKSLTYRYENQGTAEDLSVFGKTCIWNEDNRTNTGISFSQTERKKCFDIPSEKQIWIKFDLYHINSPSRFRVYNEIADKPTGLCNRDNKIILYNYGTEVFSSSDVEKYNVLQSWLLYMRADDNGEIVLWCDGKEITRYTGNVNNGEPFNNISMSGETYLWSSETTYTPNFTMAIYETEYYTYTHTEPFPYEADLNHYFSNVIISNEEISVDESLCGNIADIQLNISNITDIENYLMINMPFTSSTTEDLCGNEFTTIGEPRIELSPYMNSNALYLDGTTAIESVNTFIFNRNPFTISFEFAAIFSETLNSSEMVLCHFYNENSSIKLNISVEGKVYLLVNNTSMTRIMSADTIGGMEHFVELNYDGAYFYLFVDGKKMKFSYKVFSEFQPYKLSIGTGDSKYFDGWIRNFKLYQNICIHNDINYDSSDLLLEKEFLNQDTINFNLYVDITVRLNNDNWLPALENIRDYLPCDTSPIQTLTNNSWSYNTQGTLVYRSGMGPALNFIGPRSSYNLYCNNIQLGGRDFTIKFWMNIDGYPHNINYASTPLFNLLLNNDIVLDFRSLDDFNKQIYILCFTLATRIDFEINKYHLIEYIYRHKEKKIAVYVDKKCIVDVYHQIPETVFNTLGFIKFDWDPEKKNIKLDEIQVYDGISFYNKFVPATKNYYDRLKNKFVDNTKTSQFNYECSIIRKLYYTPFLPTNLLFNYPNNIIPRGDKEFQLLSGGNILINDYSKPCQAILEFPSYYKAVIDGPVRLVQMFCPRKLLLGGQDFVIMFDIAFWPSASSDVIVSEFLRLSMSNSFSSAVLTLQSNTDSTYIYYYPNKDGNTSKYDYTYNYTPRNMYTSLTKMGRILIRYNHNASKLSYITNRYTLTISNVTIYRTLYELRIGNYRNDLATTTNTYFVHYLKNIRIYDGNTVGNSVLLQYQPSEDELLMVYNNINDTTRFSFEADINIILVINNDITINPHKTCLVLYKHFDVDKNITIDPSYNDMTFVTSPLISKYGLSLNHPQKIVDRIMLHQNIIMLDFWVYIKNGSGHMIRMYDTNDVFLFGVYNDGNRLYITTPISNGDHRYRSNDLIDSVYELNVPIGSYAACLPHKWVSLKIVISSTYVKVLINDVLVDNATFTKGIPDIFSEQKEVYLMVGSDKLKGYINDIRLYDNYYRYRYGEIPTKQSYEQIERQRLSNAYKFYRRVDTEIEVINPERINIVIWHNNQPFKIPFHKAKSRSEVPDNSVSFYHKGSVWYSPIVLPTDIEASILRIFHNDTIVSLPTRIHNT